MHPLMQPPLRMGRNATGPPGVLFGKEVEDQMSPLHGRGWHEGLYVSRMGNAKRRDWGPGGEPRTGLPLTRLPGLGVHRDTALFCQAGTRGSGGHISCSYSSGHQKVNSHTHSRTREKQGAGGDWVSLRTPGFAGVQPHRHRWSRWVTIGPSPWTCQALCWPPGVGG